jgi:hypothetical protein
MNTFRLSSSLMTLTLLSALTMTSFATTAPAVSASSASETVKELTVPTCAWGYTNQVTATENTCVKIASLPKVKSDPQLLTTVQALIKKGTKTCPAGTYQSGVDNTQCLQIATGGIHECAEGYGWNGKGGCTLIPGSHAAKELAIDKSFQKSQNCTQTFGDAIASIFTGKKTAC